MAGKWSYKVGVKIKSRNNHDLPTWDECKKIKKRRNHGYKINSLCADEQARIATFPKIASNKKGHI